VAWLVLLLWHDEVITLQFWSKPTNLERLVDETQVKNNQGTDNILRSELESKSLQTHRGFCIPGGFSLSFNTQLSNQLA
jgi:hypothetical protein